MTQQSSPQYTEPGRGGDRWSRRPRRSANDRKIAGVAGGLGRAFGIDPIILRVAFVVLAIFGGSGVLLYALGWLLLPADGDQVSAIEGMLGRGRSSVSPLLTVVLIIVTLSSAGSVFSWGLPFWPVVIGAIILFLVARRGRLSHRGWNGPGWNPGAGSGAGTPNAWNSGGDPAAGYSGDGSPDGRHSGCGRDWNQWGNDVAERANRWATDFSDRAARWGRRGPWAGPGWGSAPTADPTGNPTGRSPFEGPAFWDDSRPGATGPSAGQTQPSTPAAGQNAAAGGQAAAGGKAAATGQNVAGGQNAAGGQDCGPSTTPPVAHDDGQSAASSATAPSDPSPTELLTGNRTPPAWDPLGVAPFAWDLPDPTPVPQAPAPVEHRGSVLSRVFVGIALLAGAVAGAGVIAGWWALSWAEVSAIALTVVAFGLIIAALRGRGRPLIGPGIFLALLTLALTVTGISGTQGYGAQHWTPTSIDEIDNQTFTWNAGGGTLDLSALDIAADTTVTTTLEVRAGEAAVIVPADVTVHATCSANIGQVDCLTITQDGLRPTVTTTQVPAAGTAPGGTLDLTVKVGAGHVTVRHG